MNTVAPRKLCLFQASFLYPQVVKTQIGRNVRLIVVLEVRARLRHIDPFRESFSPPFVILGNWVKLGKIECDCTHTWQ